MDGLRHRRQITILPSSEGSRWQVLDRTFTEEGDLVAGKSVLLGIDEDEHLVWPPEYELLLSE
jgi:hypothetical protein